MSEAEVIITITLTTGLVFHVDGDEEDASRLMAALSSDGVTALTFSRPRIVGRNGDNGAHAITVRAGQVVCAEYLARGKGEGPTLLHGLRTDAGDLFFEGR